MYLTAWMCFTHTSVTESLSRDARNRQRS